MSEAPSPGERSAAPDGPEAWAERLHREWEERARSEERDFFVMAHSGWDDPDAWQQQARNDVAALWAFARPDPGHVLEVGCGVGRLAPALLERARSYTGVDIAPSMVEEARSRCAHLDRARFHASDGCTLPLQVRDRGYALILAHAVLIHCPRPVIAATIRNCLAQLASGGCLYVQLYADPSDPRGIAPVALPLDLVPVPEPRAATRSALTDAALISDRYWEGHRFGYREAGDFLTSLTSEPFELVRPDTGFLYACIRRGKAAAPGS